MDIIYLLFIIRWLQNDQKAAWEFTEPYKLAESVTWSQGGSRGQLGVAPQNAVSEVSGW